MRLAIALAAVLLTLLLLGCLERRVVDVREADARKLILEDLQAKFPDADVREILFMNFSESSWNVKARITWGRETPCPKRIHVYYDYPKRGFEISNPEVITAGGAVTRGTNCSIGCIPCPGGDRCMLAFEEQAVIASHAMIEGREIREFVCRFDDAKAEAKSYAEYRDAYVNKTYEDVWLVKWSSGQTNVDRYALIRKDGTGFAEQWSQVKAG
ncbi:MAG: hypothetical protein QXH27_01605 [Candidatus Micrarchaeia archaeon]